MNVEGVLREHTVVVEMGRVTEIGPSASVQIPAGAFRIDARGKYLMPGLAEMHAHLPVPEVGEEVIERTLFLNLAGGVTTVRGMLGHPSHLQLRDRTERGEILGPRIFTSGPSFHGNSATDPNVAVRMVREQKLAGYDFLKVHPGPSRPTFDAMAATAAEVGIPFAGHVPVEVGLHRALEAGMASIEHLDGYVEALAGLEPGTGGGLFGFGWIDQVDLSRLESLATTTRAAGTWNVPTQSLIEHRMGPQSPATLAQLPEMRYMPAATVAQWVQAADNLRLAEEVTPDRRQRFIDVRRQLVRALHDAGAGLLLGSDAPQVFNVPGFAIHHELRMLVESGLIPYQALLTGTRNPAIFFGKVNDFGAVVVGQRADLLLLDANPLENIANVSRIAGVMVDGRWLARSDLDRRLRDVHCLVRPTKCEGGAPISGTGQ